MKIVQINIFPNLSTGNIMSNIHKRLLEEGIESYIVWGRGRKANNEHEIFMNDKMGIYYHVLYTRMTDKIGFASKRATKKLLKRLDEIKPDIIHLHNIHGYYINIEMLFHYIKENNIKVVWTLHDCWAFTGHCAYFEVAHCNKWKKGCYDCPQLNTYPISNKDNTEFNYKNKKELFNGIENMNIITVSKWLESKVKESFLLKYNISTIYNGIDLNVFYPRKNNLREKYNLQDKKIILGVASTWSERKGLEDFIELSKVISDEYKIILLGLNKKQLKKMPENILALERTDTIDELAEFYSVADVYFNASMEETFGLTTVEAMACGTPAIVYNSTALPEVVSKNSGIVVEPKNIKEVLNSIKLICESDFFEKDEIIMQAKRFNKIDQFNKYNDLYKKIIYDNKIADI